MMALRNAARTATKAMYTPANEIKRQLSDTVVHGMTPQQRKYVGLWLMGCAAGVYFGVSAGGFTRLSEAAMKMVDRHPFRWIPPFGHWEEEFENYKKFDEYKLLTPEDRSDLTLSEYKYRWFLAYFHRMGGRMLFLAFTIPCVIFWRKGYFNALLKKHLLLAGILLTAQIPLGWWMVHSGLHRELMANKEKPGVSQYRMAAHLIIPFFLYGIFVYNGLSMLLKPQDHSTIANIGRSRIFGKALITLLLVGSFMGSFLTALDAAEPEYARKWLPDDLFVMEPKWKNIFENKITANFVHRYIGYITFATINITYFVCRRQALHPRARLALKGIMAMGYTQLLLGITTLYFRDPPVIAWLHQNFSVHLFTFMIWFIHEIRRLPK